MQNNEMKQAVGSLRISQDVISTIASYAAAEIDGVASLASFASNMKGWFFKKQTVKPIAIELNDNIVVIDIRINIKFGYKVTEVSEALQTAVKDAVQTMTGLTVARVNVHVAGIVFETTKYED